MLKNQEVNKLRQSAREVIRELGLLGDAYFEIGVTLAERHLLIEVSQSIYPDVKEIALRLLLDKSTASRLIARAVKKGFLTYCQDKSDKRRKCVQLTEKGEKTLTSFESIAHNQTKNALTMLTPEEAESVMKGVELYALGLKRARLTGEYLLAEMKNEDHIPFLQAFKEIIPLAEIETIFKKIQGENFHYFLLKKDSKIYGGVGVTGGGKNMGEEKISHLVLSREAERLDLGYTILKLLNYYK